MKLHTSRTTISCPTGFGFLAFRTLLIKNPKIMLSGLTTAHGESYTVEMPKAALWKPCSEMMPVHHFNSECHSCPPSCQDAWGCWEPAASAGAQSQELRDSDSDVDSVPWHSCSRSPGLQHVLHLAGAHVEAKTFWAIPLCYTPARSFPALWVLSISKKQMHIWESTHTDMHFFSQPGPVDVFKSNRCDTLFGFVWKELEDQNHEVQLACTY